MLPVVTRLVKGSLNGAVGGEEDFQSALRSASCKEALTVRSARSGGEPQKQPTH